MTEPTDTLENQPEPLEPSTLDHALERDGFGKLWLLHDAMDVVPAHKAPPGFTQNGPKGVMVVFSYKRRVTNVLHFPGVELRSTTDEPEACCLTMQGIEGRQEVLRNMRPASAAPDDGLTEH